MPVVGLTGGIAAGKSTVAGLLAGRGAAVINADLVARELVEPGQPALAEIASRFGAAYLRDDGTLDRAALAERIFADPLAREDLNAILHPRIFAAIRRQLDRLNPDRVAVVEAALLAETYDRAVPALGMQALVVVDAPAHLQTARMKDRGLSGAQAAARLAAQADPSFRRSLATHVIDNSGSLDDLERAVEEVWDRLAELGPTRA